MAKPRQVAEAMLARLDLDLVSCSELQTLWAGYGHVCALEARSRHGPSDEPQRLILKLISPPPLAPHHHQATDEGHVRKMLSYQVEQFWYDELAPRLDSEVAVARCLASTRSRPFGDQGPTTATILSDLRVNFPVAVHRSLTPCQVHAALDWLARFHGSAWRWLPDGDRDSFVGPPLQEVGKNGDDAKGVVRAAGLWLNGGYTYLATRRREYAALAADDASEWSHALCRPDADGRPPVAEQAAAFLAPGGGGERWQTCIHGDVKSENLFATTTGDAVAFFDFQYVGLGLGVCDLAKLFTCSVPLNMLATDGEVAAAERHLPMSTGETELLERYRARLLQSRQKEYEWKDLVRHWETALVDWCRFQASWGFWGNTDWLQARVRDILADVGWRAWLRRQQ
ncbi:hypothetical protein L249_4883 [Ophiocordyceps polyrhachis-furcata BCC 54312]|uniref:Aminoglycoside phosphotransferase domain-containing protein n=1 Tax=Ophiocordyceps polyrhachis-furcata BCC 54312 TaxID=1330021 RepID=A0A367L2U1_9HYPO|nr:hypothetical protein L249_4883 [Ophiocordyceps polyrhachis-furcata BCC 54312]